MGKKIKKAINKVTKAADVLGVHESDKKPKAAATVAAPTTPAPAAATVANPETTSTDTTESDTEAAKKSARSRGKSGLSVARSSGTGLNV